MTAALLAAGWIKRGSVWVNPVMEAQSAALDDTDTDDEDDYVLAFMGRLAAQLAARPVLTHRVVLQRTCRDCGCLLHPGETCPSCRWVVVRWCEDADVRHSWRPIPYTPRALLEEVAAA